MIGDEIGVVKVGRVGLDNLFVVHQAVRIVVIFHAGDGSPVLFKTTIAGPVGHGFGDGPVPLEIEHRFCLGLRHVRDGEMTQMPFAHHGGVVTGRAENLGDRYALVVELALVGGFMVQRLVHGPDSRFVRIQPSQQRSARRAAPGHVVKLRKAKALLRHRVDVWRMNLAAVTSQVGKAHVIGENNNNVGRGAGAA